MYANSEIAHARGLKDSVLMSVLPSLIYRFNPQS